LFAGVGSRTRARGARRVRARVARLPARTCPPLRNPRWTIGIGDGDSALRGRTQSERPLPHAPVRRRLLRRSREWCARFPAVAAADGRGGRRRAGANRRSRAAAAQAPRARSRRRGHGPGRSGGRRISRARGHQPRLDPGAHRTRSARGGAGVARRGRFGRALGALDGAAARPPRGLRSARQRRRASRGSHTAGAAVSLSTPAAGGAGPAATPRRWPHRAHAEDGVGGRHPPARVRAAGAAREAGRAHSAAADQSGALPWRARAAFRLASPRGRLWRTAGGSAGGRERRTRGERRVDDGAGPVYLLVSRSVARQKIHSTCRLSALYLGTGAEGWGAENGRSVNQAFGRGAPALPSTADGASPATRR